MTEKNLTESSMQEENCTIKKQSGAKLFQTISLILLPLLWVGYFYSLYRGNESNISSYSTAILAISLLNSDVLLTGEKTQYKVFNILAKLESILLVVLGIITIVLVILK